mmetsp:Transcript_14911/g.36941  ORF Transcript_14911/g.36941 Transcript_14911/m.36941 type:complete len:104 (-) Transcript_14911:157-468(-)
MSLPAVDFVVRVKIPGSHREYRYLYDIEEGSDPTFNLVLQVVVEDLADDGVLYKEGKPYTLRDLQKSEMLSATGDNVKASQSHITKVRSLGCGLIIQPGFCIC